MSASNDPWPRSIAIAGAWGYIGRKFLDTALRQGIVPYVYDPGPAPPDVPLERLQRAASEVEFYRLPADLFHLALHPQARQTALAALLDRDRRESIAILNEKPMAPPEQPELCRWLIAAVEGVRSQESGVKNPGAHASIPHSPFPTPHLPLLLFDFHELYSPLTERIVAWLAGRRNVSIESIEMARSKDREDPSNPRNYKRMLPIQYQESVHCLAWVLHLLGRLHGSVDGVCDAGLTVTAQSQPYAAPNPQDYPYVVDGQCDWELRLGPTLVTGRTDFKRGAPWTKRRIVRGTADGRPFTIKAEYQEGRKHLAIDGVDQGVDAQSSSPVEVIRTFGRWRRDVPRDELLHGIYPNPRFAYATYQLSSALWRASYDRRELRFDSLQSLLDFDAGYAAAMPQFAHYQ